MAWFLNTSSLEDWYPGQPAEILRPVTIVERYEFDGRPRLKVRIDDGPEKGRIVSSLSPSNLRDGS